MSASPSNPPDHDPLTHNKQDRFRQNDKNPQLPHITRRQVLALPILAAAPNMRQTARDAGINESTLYRWLKDEYFRDELRRLAAEAAEHIHQELQSPPAHTLELLTMTPPQRGFTSLDQHERRHDHIPPHPRCFTPGTFPQPSHSWGYPYPRASPQSIPFGPDLPLATHIHGPSPH